MLTVSPDLTSYTLGAGEPFLLQVAFQATDGTPLDLSARAFVLTFYKAPRAVVTKIDGELSADGKFLRFEEDGTFSNGLYGQTLTVELAERLKGGRDVIATGNLTVRATADTVASFDNGPVGKFAVRVVYREADAAGDALTFSQSVVAYVPPGTAPIPQLTLTGPLTYAADAAEGTLIANIGNVPAGVTPTVTPVDGREVIAGDATNGWKIVKGMTASSAGTIATTVAATGATSVTEDVTVTAPTPTVTLSAAQSKAEGNSGATLFQYTVTRSSSSGAVNVPWSFAAGSTDASDYTGGTLPTGGTVAMADGVATGTITISVNGDTTVEPDEQFTVSIAAPAGYAAGSAMSATGTILNDDTAAPTGFALNGSTNPTLKAMLARVKAGTGRGKLVWKGDSTLVGAGAGTGTAGLTGARFSRPSAVVANLLTSAGIPALDTGVCADNAIQVSGSNGSLDTYDSRVSFGGWRISNATETFAGGGTISPPLDGNSSAGMTFTMQNTDTFEAIIYNSAGSVVTFAIDGAAPATTTVTSGGATAAGNTVSVSAGTGFSHVTLTAASVGTHTLTMTCNNNQVAVQMIRGYVRGTAAIDAYVHANCGAKAGDEASSNGSWNNLEALTDVAPDLTIINLGLNDGANGVSVQSYTSSLQALITAAKASGDVLLVSPHPAAPSFAPTASQTALRDAAKSLATSTSTAYLDLYAYFGSYDAVSARLYDNAHPKAEMYAEIGQVVERCVVTMAT